MNSNYYNIIIIIISGNKIENDGAKHIAQHFKDLPYNLKALKL